MNILERLLLVLYAIAALILIVALSACGGTAAPFGPTEQASVERDARRDCDRHGLHFDDFEADGSARCASLPPAAPPARTSPLSPPESLPAGRSPGGRYHPTHQMPAPL